MPLLDNDYHYQRHAMTRALTFITFATAAALYAVTALAAGEFALTIRDHRFHPSELQVPAGQKIKLVIHNEDPTPEEFESHELQREKIIKGHGKGVVFVGPLEPGEYPFFGEFHMDTALGKLVAK